MKASEITIAEGDEESSSDEDDEDDDEDDDDETESVTVVGEHEEKAVDVLETIEEEKVSAVRFNLFDPGLSDTHSGLPSRASGCIHGCREGLDTVP